MTETSTAHATERIGPPASSDILMNVNHSRAGYGRLWALVPRELGFLLLAMPIAIIGFGVLSALFWAGIGMLVIYIGFFVLLAALFVARAFATLETVRLRWAGRPELTRPQWRPANQPANFWRSTFGPLINGHYWLDLLHGLIINPIVSVVTWSITITWVAGGLGGVTYWFWGRFLPVADQQLWLHEVVVGFFFPGVAPAPDVFVGESIFQLVVGILFLVTLPWITHGLVLLHDAISRGMLGIWRSEVLQREVADLSASRGAALAAEDMSLRRLERDIHDGPQQRLVRLQMDLASAERSLEKNPDAARDLLAQARGQAQDTLEELRALSRGFAPPILQDRGLIVGLQSLAARSVVPVQFEQALEPDVALSPEIERSAYFVAAELLTNVAKHSAATQARLHVALRPVPGHDVTWLDLWVIDNGRGGAVFAPGHGLAGLYERVRGLRGILSVDSPAGGPTAIGAHIPLSR